MIVVATEDFEVYHEVVDELRQRGLEFTTVEPRDELPDSSEVVVTTQGDGAVADDDGVPVVRATAGQPRAAVDEAVAVLREEGGRTVIGIDPGDRPGVAVLRGDRVVAVFQVPIEDVGDVVSSEVADSVDPLVRVGDGARLAGTRIVEALEDVPVELVDETGTTPHLGTGARGMGDVLAAVNIARESGERVDSIDVDPTDGEIQVVQNRSRERTGSETLPTELARAVAAGELTMAEALDQHRERREDSES